MVYSKSKKSKKSNKTNKTKKGGSYSPIHKERKSVDNHSLHDNSSENIQRVYEQGYNNGSKKHPKLILNKRITISLFNSNEDPVTELKIKNAVDGHIGSDCIVKKTVKINNRKKNYYDNRFYMRIHDFYSNRSFRLKTSQLCD